MEIYINTFKILYLILGYYKCKYIILEVNKIDKIKNGTPVLLLESHLINKNK